MPLSDLVGKLLTVVATVLYYVLRPFWLGLWPPLQLLYLLCKRTMLRANNLLAAPTLPPLSNAIAEQGTPKEYRTFDGSGNDLERKTTAMSGCPFMRNTQPASLHVRADHSPAAIKAATPGPDPIEVSQKVLARPNGQTKTHPLVNLLGGAWIQFMIHDWFELQKNPSPKSTIEFEFPGSGGKTVMPLQEATKTRDGSNINSHDHWWSGCQIYGSTPDANKALRTGVDGKLKLSPDGSYLAVDPATGRELVGFNQNLWSGLQLMHFLFAKEHNTVCDMLKKRYPSWDDKTLFQTARKIIAALIARIHTVEWTCAIIQHPTGRATQYILWYGFLGVFFRRKLLGLAKLVRDILPGPITTLLFGIPGSATISDEQAPFAHSHDFTTVYRMHALLPDKVEVLDAATAGPKATVSLEDIIFKKGTKVNQTVPIPDLLTSLGFGHAGALELRNYPTALRNLVTPRLEETQQPGGPKLLMDIGAVDVWRSREAQLPLFNDFLKGLAMKPYTSFNQLGRDDAAARAALKEVYGNVNAIDVMVGLLAEEPLPGWIFGEAIYTIFVLQTQRRLESDRFYTKDYTEEVYTPEGLDWVEKTTMSDILKRHVPALGRYLAHDTNAFIPWGSTNKRRLFERVLWDVLFPWQVYGWLRKMGYKV